MGGGCWEAQAFSNLPCVDSLKLIAGMHGQQRRIMVTTSRELSDIDWKCDSPTRQLGFRQASVALWRRPALPWSIRRLLFAGVHLHGKPHQEGHQQTSVLALLREHAGCFSSSALLPSTRAPVISHLHR